jgi:hypothetical protein
LVSAEILRFGDRECEKLAGIRGPIGTSESDSNPLTPTFKWDFKGEDDPCGLPNLEPNKDIHEVNLYVSVFPEGEGLLPMISGRG